MGSVKRHGKVERYMSGVVFQGKCIEEWSQDKRTDLLSPLDEQHLIRVVHQLCEALVRTWDIYKVRRDVIEPVRHKDREVPKTTDPRRSKPV